MLQILVDTGASDNFLKVEAAEKLGIPFQKETG